MDEAFGVRELMARVRALLRRAHDPSRRRAASRRNRVTYKHIESTPLAAVSASARARVDLTTNDLASLRAAVEPRHRLQREALLARV